MAFGLSKNSQGKGKRPASGARASGSSNKKLLFIGFLLVVSVLVTVASFTLSGIFNQQNQSYTSVVSEQQVVAQQIAVSVLEAAQGNRIEFSRLDTSRNLFINNLRKLTNGDKVLNLPPLPEFYDPEVKQLQGIWGIYNGQIQTVLAAEDAIAPTARNVADIDESMPELRALFDGIISDLVNSNAPRKNVVLATEQLALLNGVENSLEQILNDGALVIAAIERLNRDSNLIDIRLLAMIKGDNSQQISAFSGVAVIDKLLKFNDLFSVVRKNIDDILGRSDILVKMHEASLNIQWLAPGVVSASAELIEEINGHDEHLVLLNLAGFGFGALSVLWLILLAMLVVRGTQSRLGESQEQNEKNQRAILRLLDEMTNLADGDLTTHTTVSEDITGAIADSVNYSIDALRDLVSTINNTAVQVSSAVRKTQGTTAKLAEESEAQAREITGATSSISKISQSMSAVSEKATDSAEVARKSVSIAHTGGATVRQAINGMETIRGQIQETSKRIKRLGESSQEIGDIVNLITEISDQTNILALNAAIQASMAGEAGRGFAVVADEVQRLAERTGDATKQIEALVKTIQADTNEAMVSMEQSTANVVKGAKLTENAGSALDKIEQVSMNLAQRILEISDATKSQASESVKITRIMDVIQQITQKTSEGSHQASGSIGELSSMVKAMHKSVAGFKLPGMKADDSAIMHDVTELSVEKINS